MVGGGIGGKGFQPWSQDSQCSQRALTTFAVYLQTRQADKQKSFHDVNQSTPLITENTTGFFRIRRRTIGQFQCCLCVIILIILIMTLIITVSYSLRDNSTFNETRTLMMAHQLLRSNWRNSTPVNYPSLSKQEWEEAIQAGERAIMARNLADKSAQLFNPHHITPLSRHRTAVKTSPHVRIIAMSGVGQLGATQHIEKIRKDNNLHSAIGAYFNGKWSPHDNCDNSFFTYCNSISNKYRMYNGSCNHPQNRGAAFSEYSRLLPPDYADGIEEPRVAKSGKPLPSAREISLRIHNPSPSVNPSFTVMLAVFGQFIDHDMTATAISQGINGSSLACCSKENVKNKLNHPECYPVVVGPGDPVYDITGSTCMEFVRSAPASQCKIGPRQQLNQVTSFIDGSTIYGTEESLALSLRSNKSGQLRMYTSPDGRSLLPPSTDPYDGCNSAIENKRGRYCFITGDARANENLHLTSMHLLWARQHNLIAKKLQLFNPKWSDERLYQESRRIVGAQLQHITYNEFLPIILGDDEMINRKLMPLTDDSYRNNQTNDSKIIDTAISNNFASAAFRFAHSLLPSLMKMTDNERGSEDYIELHKMLFNPYSLYNEGGIESAIKSATSNFIQKTSTHVTSQLTRHLFQDPLHEDDDENSHHHHLITSNITSDNNLKSEIKTNNQSHVTLPCGLDLVSLNIQRGRDHGLPGYTVWREYCGLSRPRSFDQLVGIIYADNLNQIQQVYDHVDDIDLYTGALAEIKTQSDGIVGPTFTCLIADQFQRLQMGDRYWYELSNQPYPFTPDQLVQLRKSSLAKLICDCSDNIVHIQPQIMRSVDSTINPITLCEDINGPDFTAWKEKK
ncbi:hypothetical protein PV326_004246 [Microctonus aethiopoides]|nr:hypothetical protein PV326_004246 [Microctonus aethiopoides]